MIKPDNPCYLKLANTWIVLNSAGGPTPDKPGACLDLHRVNRLLNLRVADIRACYEGWGNRGAFFLTEPLDNQGGEWHCWIRAPSR